MKLPHDITLEFRAYHARRRRTRHLALVATAILCITSGFAIGALAALATTGQIILLAALTAFGCWGSNYILRH